MGHTTDRRMHCWASSGRPYPSWHPWTTSTGKWQGCWGDEYQSRGHLSPEIAEQEEVPQGATGRSCLTMSMAHRITVLSLSPHHPTLCPTASSLGQDWLSMQVSNALQWGCDPGQGLRVLPQSNHHPGAQHSKNCRGTGMARLQQCPTGSNKPTPLRTGQLSQCAVPRCSAALIAAAPATERREPCSGAKTKPIQCWSPLRFLGGNMAL